MVKISTDKRFLVDSKGEPFFYLADTAWSLFHRLKKADAEFYLSRRASQGFTVIQSVILSENGGLHEMSAEGKREFLGGDIARPNPDYFNRIGEIIDYAATLGLTMALLPSWGDKIGVKYWGDGPANFINEENAFEYGRFLADFFKQENIIWILGGDQIADCNESIYDELAAGIRSGGTENLISFHPQGGFSSSFWFHNRSWLDFNLCQSGHYPFTENWKMIYGDYGRIPVKPCLDGEPVYEDHPIAFDIKLGYTNDWQVRTAAYWSVFSGAMGHTYGCHAVWQFADENSPFRDVNYPRRSWMESLDLPGAIQMKYLKHLMLSRPYMTRFPDLSLIRSGQSCDSYKRIASCRDDGTYLMVYFPMKTGIGLRTDVIRGESLCGWWFDPSTGSSEYIDSIPRSREWPVAPPGKKEGSDWVLIVEDRDVNYPDPGI
ncbi:MAG: DUF4038 domain-containing protein [Spirochaetales bacterium]|nr:DUF4038 domain-containing protein [Spirochaetales bacterium]